MIKINLASQKRAAALSAGGGGSGGGGGGTRLNLSADQLKNPVIRKVIIFALIGFGLNFLIEEETNEALAKLDRQIAKVQTQQAKMSAELQKNNGYLDLKRSLDADEEILRRKLEVMTKLSEKQNQPSKLLVALSGSIPREVWIDDYSTDEASIKMGGLATGFDQVSEFMRVLSESAFYDDLNLASSEQSKDDLGVELVKFNLTAKRRE